MSRRIDTAIGVSIMLAGLGAGIALAVDSFRCGQRAEAAQVVAPPLQDNYCRLGVTLAYSDENGILVLGLGKRLAPSVSIARPIEPFWPAVMVCMRLPDEDEQRLYDSLVTRRDTIP